MRCRSGFGSRSLIFILEEMSRIDVNIITIYGGRFLVYRYQGPYERLAEVNAKVYCELLPASGEKAKLGSGVLEHCQMFERYLNDPETTAPEELLTEIWIPIE